MSRIIKFYNKWQKAVFKNKWQKAKFIGGAEPTGSGIFDLTFDLTFE